MQVFTGAVPFNDYSNPQALEAISEGERPPRPRHPTFTESLWTLMKKCWNPDPHLRPEVSQVLQALPPSVSRSFRRLYTCWPDRFPVCSEDPAWKQLISDTITTDERISLITLIFSDHDHVKMAEDLSGNDAQNVIDAIDEVSTFTFRPLGDR